MATHKWSLLAVGLLLLAATPILAGGERVAATTICSGTGGAKTTFRPGTITSAETRSRMTWKYDCNYGSLVSPYSSPVHSNYYNSAIDATSLDGWDWSFSNGLPAYLYHNNQGSFGGSNSWLGYPYYFTLHNYIYTSNTNNGTYTRHCWIDNTGGTMPDYSLSCGNW